MTTAETPPEIRRIDPREALRVFIEEAGSARAAGRSLGCSASYVLDVRHGRRPPSARLLAGLGLESVIVPVGGGL